MELKLVYRALRKISEWTVGGFYEEVRVDGREHVPKDGPLIVASTHHNEIIDIATLAVTIPHRRHLSFWAKSSLFKNPIAGTILSSSGAIPVNRNPDNAHPSQTSTQSTQSNLFLATTYALSRGGAIGVFPEGTSYTEPRIMQVKGGAGWAAVEYAKWEVEHGQRVEGGRLVVVPVAVVYTDKAVYRSRVLVRYGVPITVDTTDPNFLSSDYHIVVKGVTNQIEKQLVSLSVNAPDWDTLNAARMARDILWDEERNVPLKDFVDISQTLVDLFTSSTSSLESLPHLKRALIKYFALLHYTNISHSSLAYLFPHPSASPTLPRTLLSHQLLRLQSLHPRTLLFFPTIIPFLPGYALSALAAHFLATHGEEEAEAQAKAVAGGIGVGIGCLGVGWAVVHRLIQLGTRREVYPHFHSCLARYVPVRTLGKVSDNIVGALVSFGRVLGDTDGGRVGKMKRAVGIMGVLYATGWALVKWHNLLVGGNYRRFKHLLASYKIIIGLISPRSSDVPLNALAPYTTPPPLPVNPYIQQRITAESDSSSDSTSSTPPIPPAKGLPKPRMVSSRKLIRHLLEARVQATVAFCEYLDEVEERKGNNGAEKVRYLRAMGGKIDAL